MLNNLLSLMNLTLLSSRTSSCILLKTKMPTGTMSLKMTDQDKCFNNEFVLYCIFLLLNYRHLKLLRYYIPVFFTESETVRNRLNAQTLPVLV